MKKRLLAVLALTIMAAPMAVAQNTFSMKEKFASILDVLATPAEGFGIAMPSWDDIEKIRGVHWEWPRNEIVHHMGKNGFEMRGTLDEYSEVRLYGARTFIDRVEISFGIVADNMGDQVIYIDHFNPDQLTKIPTSCDEDRAAAAHQEAFYQWIKPGYTPLYIYYASSFGSQMGSVEYNINYVLDDILTPYLNPCEVLH